MLKLTASLSERNSSGDSAGPPFSPPAHYINCINLLHLRQIELAREVERLARALNALRYLADRPADGSPVQ